MVHRRAPPSPDAADVEAFAVGLASALWATGESAARRRARTLVEQASRVRPENARAVRVIEEWIATHGAPR